MTALRLLTPVLVLTLLAAAPRAQSGGSGENVWVSASGSSSASASSSSSSTSSPSGSGSSSPSGSGSGASSSGSGSSSGSPDGSATTPAGDRRDDEPDPAELRRLITEVLPPAPAAGSVTIVEGSLPVGGIDGYTVYHPRTYDEDPARRYPVLVHLQGGLAVGGDVVVGHHWGLPRRLLEEADGDEPWHRTVLDGFVIVLPHLTSGQFFDYEADIDAMLDQVVAEHRGDPARLYLTGLSRGGHGSWGLASRLAHRWAAVAPIGGDTEGVDDFAPLVELPLWVAHTARDRVVSVGDAREALGILETLGAEPFARFDSYEAADAGAVGRRHVFVSVDDTTHDAWTPTYARPAFFEWLLSHRKEGVAEVTRAEPVREWH